LSFDSAGSNYMGHTIIAVYGNNWEGLVGIGNLKRVPEELQRVARLGSPTGGGYRNPKSYALAYDFTVNAQYPIFWIQLASVMDRTHIGNQNTHFKYSIKNAIGTPLTQPCYGFRMHSNRIEDVALGAPNITFSPSIPGSTFPAVSSVAYQTWRSIAIDMTAYVGQTLTLELEHYDCYTGAHGSYTSIAAAMRSPYDTFYFCRGAATTTIKPYQPNFHTYLWNTGATTDSLFISNPTDGAIYNCTVGSYNGCQATFTYILKEIKTNADFHYVGGNTCNQIQFLDQSLTNMGKMVKWHWDFGDPASGVANVDTMQNPLHIYPSPGNYTVSLTVTDTFGCTNTITKTVSVSPEGTVAQIGLPNPSCVYAALPFEDITSNSSRRIWYIEEQKINDTSKIVYHSFSQPGTYEVMLIAIGSNGCPDTTTQSFQVYGLPQSAIQVIPQTLAAPVTDPEISVQRLGRKRH
jgi:PKD repeat protein